MTPQASHGDDRPSKAVLDELLAMFDADDPDAGRDIDLDSPEVEALLSGSQPRPRPADTEPAQEAADDSQQAQGFGPQDVNHSAADDSHEAQGFGPQDVNHSAESAEGSASDEAASSEPQASETNIAASSEPQASETNIAESSEPEASETDIAVIIDDDELPDVAYLEDEASEVASVTPADASVGARTSAGDAPSAILIDDDSKSFEVVGSAEAARATGIEPKLRERRDAVRKAHGRRRLRWIALAIFVVVLVIAGLAVLGSSIFSIKEVEVAGAVYSRDELAPIVEDIEGQPVLRLDTGEFEDRIVAIPWVEDATVKTHFPDRATIEVSEREPVATFQGRDARFRVIDREGRVLDIVDGQPADYLLVRSDDPPDTPRGEHTSRGFAGAASITTALTSSVAPLVEVVEVANDGSDLRLQLTGGTEVRLGDDRNLADKLVRLETVLDGRTEGLPSQIDVSTNDVTTSGTG